MWDEAFISIAYSYPVFIIGSVKRKKFPKEAIHRWAGDRYARFGLRYRITDLY